jgi:hypothetical protein
VHRHPTRQHLLRQRRQLPLLFLLPPPALPPHYLQSLMPALLLRFRSS